MHQRLQRCGCVVACDLGTLMLRRHRPLARAFAATAALLLLSAAAPHGRQSRLSPWLDTAVRQARAGDVLPVWIYFADKGPAGTAAHPSISARALARRATRGLPTATAAFEDRPLAAAYVAQVVGLASRVRQQSRWLNAMSVEATPEQIARLSALRDMISVAAA